MIKYLSDNDIDILFFVSRYLCATFVNNKRLVSYVNCYKMTSLKC